MGYELSHPDPYNREDVENMMSAAENFTSVVARNQPAFISNYPWSQHVKASLAGEWMRFCSNPPYDAKIDFWKITKDGKFIAYGISRTTQCDPKDLTKLIYPLVGFHPLNWEGTDTFSALKFFVDNWLEDTFGIFGERFKTLYLRAPFGETLKVPEKYKVWKVTDFPDGRARRVSGYVPYYTIYAIELTEK